VTTVSERPRASNLPERLSRRPSDLRRTALRLSLWGCAQALILFALETTVTHLLIITQHSETQLSTTTWLINVSTYACVGLIATLPFVLILAWQRSDRAYSLSRDAITLSLLAVYVIALRHLPSSCSWAPLVNPTFLITGAVVALVAERLTWTTPLDKPAPWTTLAFGWVTWSSLLYLSVAPVVACQRYGNAPAPMTGVGEFLLALAAGAAGYGVAWVRLLHTGAPGESSPSQASLRRAALGALAFVYAGLTPAACVTSLPPPRLGGGPAVTGHPDLLMVVVDTLRADHLDVYGDENEQSPHIDAFADEAIRYMNHMAAAPWTTASFASIITGCSPAFACLSGRVTPSTCRSSTSIPCEGTFPR
jgi:hypothetical protein